jgi:hypothetical protein
MHQQDVNVKTNRTPVHKRTSTMGGADGRKRKRGILRWPDMRNQMSTIQATHRVREEVDAAAACMGLELAVEPFGTGGDGACSRCECQYVGMTKSRRAGEHLPRYGSNDHLRSHRSSQDAQDVGPVVHTHAWEIGGPARVESV